MWKEHKGMDIEKFDFSHLRSKALILNKNKLNAHLNLLLHSLVSANIW